MAEMGLGTGGNERLGARLRSSHAQYLMASR
jgi:hypothetical protein